MITWNIARRHSRLRGQVAFLLAREPDVVALQEVTAGMAGELRSLLPAGGLQHIRGPIDLPTSGPRSFGVLVASRFPLSDPTRSVRSPWPEKAVSLLVETARGEVELHAAHVPPGSRHGWVKVEVLESIFEAVSNSEAPRRILCGDFNAPQLERSDGEIITWGQSIRRSGDAFIRRRIRGGPGERWDRAERNLFMGLAAHGVRDVYRRLHGFEVPAHSWAAWNGTSRRFDHIFACEGLRALSSEYLHDAVAARLSDHAPLEANLALVE